MTRSPARAVLLAASSLALLALAPTLFAQSLNQLGIARNHVKIDPVACDRIVDPKLAGSQVTFRYTLAPANVAIGVTARVEKNGVAVATPFSGVETSTGAAFTHVWDGKSASGTWLDTGEYVLRLTARRGAQVAVSTMPISIVRLGVATMAGVSSGVTTNEWPLVYYKKGATYTFFATPPIHEYANVAEAGEASDLDLGNANPRPPVAVHSGLANPVLEANEDYEDATYNYPLCYLAAANPRLDVVLGASATKSNGATQGCGYPVAGFDLRCVLSDEIGAWTHSTDVTQPGQIVTYDGPALPGRGTRQDRTLTFKWQRRPTGGATWTDVPGNLSIPIRFYTLVAPPVFSAGATGTQYAGPWVEVCDQFAGWSQALAIDAVDAASATAVIVKGMFGQLPGLPTAIEGVKYDCPSVGGDGGANHYYIQSQQTIQLAKLLDGHANGQYVNCSDCAGTTSGVAGMLGVATAKMMRLGSMQLKAIWGIGCPGYTLNLWGGSHGFSYHHVVTRDDGASVVDDCLCVDEDGFPLTLPGTPGWNIDRIWTNGGTGYMELLAKSNVSKTVEILPKLK